MKIIRTSGDMIQDRPLADVGGKGLFTKEIDAALLAGEIDAAVHSAKDLPSLMPEGIAIAGFLPREDPRDALISALADTVEGLPQGASFGAASLRRQGQLLRLRPDLRPELLRGNVETRLRKAESGAVGATLLAMAGLKRLGLVHRARGPLDLEAFLPAPGQGAIALTARTADGAARDALAAMPIPRPDGRSPPNARSSPSWRAPAARRSPATLESRTAGSCSGARCCEPTDPKASPSPPTDHPPTPRRWAERLDANSPRACRRACWRAAKGVHAITAMSMA